MNPIANRDARGFQLADRGCDPPIGQVVTRVISFRRWSDETPGAEPRRLVVTLSLDQRPILGNIVESLEYRLQGDLIFPGDFFGRERIRTMDGLVDHRRSDPSTLEE